MINTQLYEKIIKVKNAKQYAKRVSVIISYVIYLMIWILAGIMNLEQSIPIFAGGILSCILIVIITWKYLFLEYEYSFCQEILTISKIYGKRKRKHLIDANMKKLLFVAPATDENITRAEQFNPERRIVSVSNEYAENIWLVVTGEENEPRMLIFIESDERVMAILKHNAPFSFVKKF